MSLYGLKKFEKIYPLFIEKFEDFTPAPDNADITVKINSLISYLNSVGRLTNDVVTDWNNVMTWSLNEGLKEATDDKIDDLISSGKLPELVEPFVNEITTLAEEQISLIETNQVATKDEINEVNTQLAQTEQYIARKEVDIYNFKHLIEGHAAIPNPNDWDWTNALNGAIEQAKLENKRLKIKLPSGIYNVNTDALTEGFNINRITLEGEFAGILQNYVQDKNVGTYIIDNSVTSTFPLFQFGSTATRTMGGLKVSNIQIVGNRQARDAIRLERIGWETVFENVYVDNFGGAGLLFNSNYDGNFSNITITRCGGATVDGLLRRSLEFIATDGSTNAIKFNNLHIEDTYFMIGANSLRHCYFMNSKFEMGLWSGAASDSMTGVDQTQSPFKIRDSQEISFINSLFVPLNISAYEAKGVLFANVPYFIDYDINTDGSLSAESALKFIGCDFSTSINGSGAKFIKNSANATVFIDNCVFDYVDGRVYALDLYGKHTILSNSKIIINNNTYGEVRAVQITNGTIKDCTVSSIGTTTIVDTDGIYSVYVKSLGKCENVDVQIGKYKIGTNSTLAIIKRIPRRVTVDNTLISSYSTLDYANIVLDLSVIDSNIIKLSLDADATIKGIKNGGLNEEVTILINNSNTYTFAYDSTKNADAVKVQTGISMKGEDVIRLIKFDHLWRDFSYSNLDGI